MLYPNPAVDIITIESTKTVTDILVIDNKGNTVLKNRNSNYIDLYGLKEGLYFVRIYFIDSIVTKSVIKL